MTFDRVFFLPFKNSYLGQCNGSVEGSRQHISPSMGEGDEGYKGSQ